LTRYEDILLDVSGGVARITVNRPARLNAMRDETADELHDALAQAEMRKDVACAVITGAGRAFGAGYDLGGIDPDQTPALDDVLERHFNPVIRRIRHSRLPIIAYVNGACAGASVGLALSCDIVVAASSAYFYEPFVGIALVPDAGNTLFLPRMAGRVRASAAMLLGDRISAEEALSWGLVWRVYDDGKAPGEVEAIAARLAERSPLALSSTKRLIREASERDLGVQLDLERDLQGEAGRSPDLKAAVAAFFSRG
jgi:2-(1,2-epoxy-1,2-dihydrophenyl)acetyl-CoA isomerase